MQRRMFSQHLFCPVDGRMVLRVQGQRPLAVYGSVIYFLLTLTHQTKSAQKIELTKNSIFYQTLIRFNTKVQTLKVLGSKSSQVVISTQLEMRISSFTSHPEVKTLKQSRLSRFLRFFCCKCDFETSKTLNPNLSFELIEAFEVLSVFELFGLDLTSTR